MAQVTYHGEFPEDREEIVQHGYTFERGKSVDVKDKDLLTKFASNRFFKTADSDKDAVEAGQEEADRAEEQTLRSYLRDENVPAHHKLNLNSLRKLKADHEKAKAEAAE